MTFCAGLFDEHPTILQPKQKKKRGKLKVKPQASEEVQLSKKGRKRGTQAVLTNAGPSSSPVPYKAKSPPQRIAKNAMIQTDAKSMVTNENLCLQSAAPETDNGYVSSLCYGRLTPSGRSGCRRRPRRRSLANRKTPPVIQDVTYKLYAMP